MHLKAVLALLAGWPDLLHGQYISDCFLVYPSPPKFRIARILGGWADTEGCPVLSWFWKEPVSSGGERRVIFSCLGGATSFSRDRIPVM